MGSGSLFGLVVSLGPRCEDSEMRTERVRRRIVQDYLTRVS